MITCHIWLAFSQHIDYDNHRDFVRELESTKSITLRSENDVRYFAGDNFEYVSLNENTSIAIKVFCEICWRYIQDIWRPMAPPNKESVHYSVYTQLRLFCFCFLTDRCWRITLKRKCNFADTSVTSFARSCNYKIIRKGDISFQR